MSADTMPSCAADVLEDAASASKARAVEPGLAKANGDARSGALATSPADQAIAGRQSPRTGSPLADSLDAVRASFGPVAAFFNDSRWRDRLGEPGVCDFAFGNPQEMPLPGFVHALQAKIAPQNKEWFAYKGNEPFAREVVAGSLRASMGLPFAPEDIALTNGGFGAIELALKLLANPGEELIYSIPSWFCYAPMAHLHGLRPVAAPMRSDFSLDVEGLLAAITEKTRIVVVNSPHNPSGSIVSAGELAELGAGLEKINASRQRPVFVLSDEAYREIVYSDGFFEPPLRHIARSVICYSYGKRLLTPGQRVGYFAVNPAAPERQAVREAMFLAQMATGWNFPSALMQYALADLEKLVVDVGALERRRDRLCDGLEAAGYRVTRPKGAFYVLAETLGDEAAFCRKLAAADVFVMPGALCGIEGHFRVSLTASDQMVEWALPKFAAVRAATTASPAAKPIR
jgi:aspartate aminotransferase